MRGLILMALGIFSFFTSNATNEVNKWPTHKTAPSILNYETGTLNGITLGDPGSRMEIIGRPENKDFQVEPDWRELKYLSSGINYEDMESEIAVFRCYFHDRWHEGYSPCFLNLVKKEKSIQVGPQTNKKEIVGFLGEPSDIDVKEEVTILYYDFHKDFYYEFDFYNKNEKISIIHAYTKQ